MRNGQRAPNGQPKDEKIQRTPPLKVLDDFRGLKPKWMFHPFTLFYLHDAFIQILWLTLSDTTGHWTLATGRIHAS